MRELSYSDLADFLLEEQEDLVIFVPPSFSVAKFTFFSLLQLSRCLVLFYKQSILGVFFIIPCVDIYEKIDMRTCTYEIPPQEVCIEKHLSFSLSCCLDLD